MKQLEMDYYAVERFDEIRDWYQALFTENNVTTLYKIRNWRESFHPEFLTNAEIYFGRPNEMNDPFDIHRPVTFDISIIERPEFFEKLVTTATSYMGVNPGRDAQIVAQKKLDEIRRDPKTYFLNNYMEMIEDPAYNDRFGIFSLTTNPCHDQLWGYYGGGLRGFAVGFDPMRLAEELFSQGNFIYYTDENHFSTVINQSRKDQAEMLFKKNRRWSFESEFRFVRLIDDQSRRFHKYSPEALKEIILGPRIAQEDKEAILNVKSAKYPHAKLYYLKCDYSNGKVYLADT